MTRLSSSATEYSRDLLETGMEATMLAMEANAVIALRTFGMCGFGLFTGSAPMTGIELNRMVAEKPPAFAASAMAAGFTPMSGQRPDQVVAAAIHPLRTETNRNVRRLGGEGDPSS